MPLVNSIVPAVLEVLVAISITILTILLPVYVIAFSLVGPSAGRRKEELDRINAEEAQTNSAAIDEAKKALENKDAEEATKRLMELEQQRYEIEKRRAQTETRYSSLSLKYALLYPSAALAIAAIMFKLAGVIYEKVPDLYTDARFILPVILAILCVMASLRFISNALLLIEELGKTVPEFNRQELANVLTTVLKERDSAKENQTGVSIDFEWDETKPPLHCRKGETTQLKYSLRLTRGTVANDVKVLFLLPPGFEFVGRASWSQSADRGSIANYRSAWNDHGKLKSRIIDVSSILVETNVAPGTYKCYYQIYSDEFVSDKRFEFDLIVDELKT